MNAVLFVCLFTVLRSDQEFFTYMESSSLPVKGCKISNARGSGPLSMHGGIVIVPRLLWHGTSVFPVSSERTAPFSRLLWHTRCGGPTHSVAFYDTQDVEDLLLPLSSRVPSQLPWGCWGPIFTRILTHQWIWSQVQYKHKRKHWCTHRLTSVMESLTKTKENLQIFVFPLKDPYVKAVLWMRLYQPRSVSQQVWHVIELSLLKVIEAKNRSKFAALSLVMVTTVN
jgi:hypothetical protein